MQQPQEIKPKDIPAKAMRDVPRLRGHRRPIRRLSGRREVEEWVTEVQ